MGLKKIGCIGIILVILSGISIRWLNNHYDVSEIPLEEELEAFTKYITINDHIDNPIFYTETEGVAPNLNFAGEIKERVILTFPKDDPQRGDFTAMGLPIVNLVEGEGYTVRLSLYNSYEGDSYPNLFHQYVLLGDELVWKYDMVAEAVNMWNPIEFSFIAEGPQTQLTIGVEAVGEIPEGWNWGSIAKVEAQLIYVSPQKD